MGVAGDRSAAEGGPSTQSALSSCSGGLWWEHVRAVNPATSAPSFLWPLARSWRLWPWDFPSLLPGAVIHNTQGICLEFPFFRPGLGTQTLWGQTSPGQLNALLCSTPPTHTHTLGLCLFSTEGSSQMNVSNIEDHGCLVLAYWSEREGRQARVNQPALSLGIWEWHQPGIETPHIVGHHGHSQSQLCTDTTLELLLSSPLVRPGTPV